jgi:nicotinate phosphoribosyltransferase
MGEEDVAALRDAVDGFGIGTYLSNAPTVDFSQDIVEVDGAPFAKRGKWSGSKTTLLCAACGAREVVPASRSAGLCPGCGKPTTPLLREAIREGDLLAKPRPPREIRADVLSQVQRHQSGKERK